MLSYQKTVAAVKVLCNQTSHLSEPAANLSLLTNFQQQGIPLETLCHSRTIGEKTHVIFY